VRKQHPPTYGKPSRTPKILWANTYCLLDTSSGAAMAVRQMLLQLKQNGYAVRILGATNFDHASGTTGLKGLWPAVKERKGTIVKLVDDPLEHLVYVTKKTHRLDMTCKEETDWFGVYRQMLEQFQPDFVFYFGGKALDFLIANEARTLGISVVFYLANGNYTQHRWYRDVKLVLTDSKATADLYTKRLGIRPVPVGKFIDPVQVKAPNHTRERLLFINPTYAKGAAIVVRLAMLMAQRRPDIVFEVVQARGSWDKVLRSVSTAVGDPKESLDNVVVTPNTKDMRLIYGRARLLLVPSLWWESGGRVLVEALINGIPAVITDCGGMPEMVQNTGIIFRPGPIFHKKPYNRIPSNDRLEPLIQCLENLYDNTDRYEQLSARALLLAETQHCLEVSTKRLVQALQPRDVYLPT
jgi:glycosyltransferase involved in cell wall biosynthesis